MNHELEPYTDVIEFLLHWDNDFRDEMPSDTIVVYQYNIEKMTSAMAAILAHADAEVRFRAVDAIPQLLPDEVVVDLLLPYLNDPIPELRWTLCEVFHSYPDSRVVLPLAKLVQGDPDPDVRVVAAEALFAVGDERAIPALTYAAEHDNGKDYEDQTVAQAARDAITTIQNRIKANQ